MSRWLALAMTPEKETTLCDNSTNGDKTQPEVDKPTSVPFCHVSHGEQDNNQGHYEKRSDPRKTPSPNTDDFEERAAIAEFDGGLTRDEAEDLAAQCQGYENVVAFRAAQHRSVSNG